MGFLGFILLCIFLVFVVRPIVKVVRLYSSIKKGDLSGIADFFNAPGSQRGNSAYGPGGERKEGWSKKRPQKKKIASDVGEYVKFSEVKTTSTFTEYTESDDKSTTTIEIEQQIVDAEWEEVIDNK